MHTCRREHKTDKHEQTQLHEYEEYVPTRIHACVCSHVFTHILLHKQIKE